ncbi:MAG: protein-glutamate O-methyltransferase CheR [Porphyrobacter sp.]|jgi:chemotaxis protein methyltransferase CheR|nr:protein-glutamate O-methyltransferase CheR [Porphyrobacter sp.]
MSLRPADSAGDGARGVGAAGGVGDPLVPGVSPQVFGRRDFVRIADMVRAEAGIVLGDQKQMLAYSRLAPLVRASGAQTFGDYLDRLASDPEAAARTIAALTTNHTYFYREPHHFDHFASQVRPMLLARAQHGEAVRLWSAGCSSGEEIWTLLMVLLGEDRAAGQALAGRDIVALASDLADHAIATAIAATYPQTAFAALPQALVRHWCEPVDTPPASLRIVPELRAMVRLRQLNLLRPWPFKGLFDVIFCRNVMIYFDVATNAQLVLALARQLRPGGYLYIGHSERVSGPAAELLLPVGPTIYQRLPGEPGA